ncbi:hypothetical protein JHK87_010416 [Glycine soja]|nr:hypothetical protein JHK87_010416 [Glycine soja]
MASEAEFRKEEVTLQVDGSTGRIIVKGERQTNEQKRVQFELAFPLPPDSDVDNISGNYDSEILHVHVPKQASHQEHNKESSDIEKASNYGSVEMPQEIESEEHNVVDEGRNHGHEQHKEDREKKKERRNENAQHMDDYYSKKLTSKLEQKRDMSRALEEVLMRNKGVVTTAVVAFSFGLITDIEQRSITFQDVKKPPLSITFQDVKKPPLGYASSKLQHFPKGLCGHGVYVPLQNIL